MDVLVPRTRWLGRMERQMIGSPESVLVYYLGFGFIILLGWAIVAPDPGRRLSRRAAARYLRWAPPVGIVGVLPPALGSATRNIVDQVGTDPPDARVLADNHPRVGGVVNATAMTSLAIAAVVMVLTIGL